MSATRILVLGVVHKLGQAHGYQVRRELLSWRVDVWARVAPGSIYQALRTLTKHGLVDPVAVEAGVGGPERTVYEITAEGESEFLQLVRNAIADPDAGAEAFHAGFAFLHLLTRPEVPDLLDARVRGLRARLGPSPEAAPGPDEPAQIAELRLLCSARLLAEIDWSLGLASRIRAGACTFTDGVANQV